MTSLPVWLQVQRSRSKSTFHDAEMPEPSKITTQRSLRLAEEVMLQKYGGVSITPSETSHAEESDAEGLAMGRIRTTSQRSKPGNPQQPAAQETQQQRKRNWLTTCFCGS